MSHTLTIRLDPELAAWLAETARRTGVPQGQIVREQLAKARASTEKRPYMRWAGCMEARAICRRAKAFPGNERHCRYGLSGRLCQPQGSFPRLGLEYRRTD